MYFLHPGFHLNTEYLASIEIIHYGNQSWGCLMEGGPLWPLTVPRLPARSSQSNTRGSGPEVLKRERVHMTSESGVSEVGSLGPSSLSLIFIMEIPIPGETILTLGPGAGAKRYTCTSIVDVLQRNLLCINTSICYALYAIGHAIPVTIIGTTYLVPCCLFKLPPVDLMYLTLISKWVEMIWQGW